MRVAQLSINSIGSRTSDEVVQLYVKQPRATIAAPSVRLASFHRIYQLAPGAKQTVTLHVYPGMLFDIYTVTCSAL
jgi:beta-glucosidase